jgi:hypothetical protein
LKGDNRKDMSRTEKRFKKVLESKGYEYVGCKNFDVHVNNSWKNPLATHYWERPKTRNRWIVEYKRGDEYDFIIQTGVEKMMNMLDRLPEVAK